jgi:hypothetical protein
MRCLVYLFIFIILFIISYIVYNKFFNTEFYSSSKDYPTIDVVITWVNGNDKEFIKEVQSFGKNSYQLERFYQNEELKYCLRSIEMNLTFIRKIFIVVREDQYPSFLKQSHYQIEYISHSTIIPPQFLPTFNSIAIENFIHKIPALSEHFIYFNDDMIVLQETNPATFFDHKHYKPYQSKDLEKIQQVSPNDLYWKKDDKGNIIAINEDIFDRNFALKQLVDQNNEILDIIYGKETRYRTQHVPYACKKSYLNELDDFLKTIHLRGKTMYENSGLHKFRDLKSIARFSFFKKYWDIYMNDCLEKKFSLHSIIINDKVDKTLEIDNIGEYKSSFLVVHNEASELTDIAISNFAVMNKKLEQLFPYKSSFEF